MKYALYNNSLSLLYPIATRYAIVTDFGHSYILTMHELLTYTDSDFTNLSVLMHELSATSCSQGNP